MTVRIVLHIGPMKTGTSALAAAFSAAQRAGTMPPGVLYPVDDLWFTRSGRLTKHPEVKDLAPLLVADHLRPREQLHTPAEVRAMLARAVDAARAIEHDGQAALVLINETAGRTADAAAVVTELRSLADEVVVVVGIREPRAAAASIIGQAVRTWGRTREHNLSARRVLTRPMRGPEHDYARLLTVWGDPAVGASLVLLPFLESENGTDALTRRFAELTGLGPVPGPRAAARGELVHPALTRRTLRRLASLKRAAAAFGWIPGVRERLRSRFESTAREAAQQARKRTQPPFTLSQRAARWVLANAQPSIEALRRQLGPDVDSPVWRAWFAQLEA